jgi:hypothetical protein
VGQKMDEKEAKSRSRQKRGKNWVKSRQKIEADIKK